MPPQIRQFIVTNQIPPSPEGVAALAATFGGDVTGAEGNRIAFPFGEVKVVWHMIEQDATTMWGWDPVRASAPPRVSRAALPPAEYEEYEEELFAPEEEEPGLVPTYTPPSYAPPVYAPAPQPTYAPESTYEPPPLIGDEAEPVGQVEEPPIEEMFAEPYFEQPPDDEEPPPAI